MELTVVNADGKKGKGIAVSEQTFGAKFNEPLIHQVVVAYQAGARSGTRAQKNRSAVSGGGTKPFRQKGTGRARAGTIRSPLWRGGGKIFPAQNQDFSQKVNRKMYRVAMRSILSELARQDRLVICDDLKVDAPKTKEFVAKLKNLGLDNVLIVTDQLDEKLLLASRNVFKVEFIDVKGLNPLSLIGHEHVLMTSEAAKQVDAWLQ